MTKLILSYDSFSDLPPLICSHMAGLLGAALLDLMLAEDWLRRIKNSRTVIITAKGEKNLYEYFKLTPSAPPLVL